MPRPDDPRRPTAFPSGRRRPTAAVRPTGQGPPAGDPPGRRCGRRPGPAEHPPTARKNGPRSAKPSTDRRAFHGPRSLPRTAEPSTSRRTEKRTAGSRVSFPRRPKAPPDFSLDSPRPQRQTPHRGGTMGHPPQTTARRAAATSPFPSVPLSRRPSRRRPPPWRTTPPWYTIPPIFICKREHVLSDVMGRAVSQRGQ